MVVWRKVRDRRREVNPRTGKERERNAVYEMKLRRTAEYRCTIDMAVDYQAGRATRALLRHLQLGDRTPLLPDTPRAIEGIYFIPALPPVDSTITCAPTRLGTVDVESEPRVCVKREVDTKVKQEEKMDGTSIRAVDGGSAGAASRKRVSCKTESALKRVKRESKEC